MPQTTIYQWSEVPAETGDGPVRRPIPGDGASLKRVEIPAGASAPRHSHEWEQFVIVVEGSGTLECDAGTVRLKPGTVLHFPPQAWHSVVFDTRTVLLEVNLTR